MGFSVRRRYNDFAWLRDTLAYKYEGLFIPSIPSTTMFTKNHVITTKTDVNGDFVKNRMSQLHLFMQQLCKIPFLRTDPSLQAFLSVQNEKEFKILVESCKNIMSDEEQSQGLVLWNTLITQNEVNADAERLITDFKRQLDSLRSMLNHLEAECKNAGKKADSCAKGLASVAEKISLWNELENNLLDPNRNEYVNLNGPKVKQYMSALEAGADHWFQNFCVSKI